MEADENNKENNGNDNTLVEAPKQVEKSAGPSNHQQPVKPAAYKSTVGYSDSSSEHFHNPKKTKMRDTVLADDSDSDEYHPARRGDLKGRKK